MIIVILTFAVIVKGLIDHFSRKQLIQKGMKAGDFDSELFREGKYRLLSNIKWAFICVGLGLALLVWDIFPNVFSNAGILGLMFVGAGIGFLVYFLVARSALEKKSNND
jgi:hypothetical protein